MTAKFEKFKEALIALCKEHDATGQKAQPVPHPTK